MSRDRVVIYEAAGADPEADLMVIENEHGRTRVRAVPDHAEMTALVGRLAGEGVDRFELCGSFGALWHAEARRVLEERTPVSAIYYGFESLASVASYKARFEAGEVLSEAFIIVHEGADPDSHRVVRHRDDGSGTTIVAVPDLDAAAELAAKLAGELQLIELYGVRGPAEAEPVIRAVVAAGVPVGMSAF
ncbi:DUF6506 family protein [Nonomuraea jiangxiensis]|uniref:Uncharacterized protein n=1 Tax=Nonomuraea jiangxiensis TaxID=633440 RepID=A0A1G8HMF9_9ACTN|nr:DUF6506 family protein [Nonomuraea jiangxiensis]SDI07691.1 hypothetical protein SAMN05421869_104219 [Nonomuraea jiangxiensis]